MHPARGRAFLPYGGEVRLLAGRKEAHYALGGTSKLGYYPTPTASLMIILTWLVLSIEVGLRRYLDPCCGKGEALAAIAAAHGPAETYGIELSDVRATDAERALKQVLNTAYEYAVLADETFSFVLLNPPYDGEGMTGGGKRLEETFLLDTTPRLMPGGVLVYIIPHQRINEKVARHLAGWYTDLRCFKLVEGDYDAFKQIVIFGVRRKTYTRPAATIYAPCRPGPKRRSLSTTSRSKSKLKAN